MSQDINNSNDELSFLYWNNVANKQIYLFFSFFYLKIAGSMSLTATPVRARFLGQETKGCGVQVLAWALPQWVSRSRGVNPRTRGSTEIQFPTESDRRQHLTEFVLVCPPPSSLLQHRLKWFPMKMSFGKKIRDVLRHLKLHKDQSTWGNIFPGSLSGLSSK